ncbi:PP2C family protein-serine/threonine phosphatase [Sphingomonas profundi]|uniref:PP2C family protein-serine/threonine phosphatase n=1 Tax=Alterirhizorhabdus profundi TaxID=2681549 RepID=UPI0012E936B3|nr:protein phosphatase 2C domain-containing protein [Sphingomonas profundi]
MALRYAVGARTHVGLVRKVNEDSILCHPAGGLWAVADGMGGHANGQWAAMEVTAGLAATGLSAGASIDSDCERLADALADANDRIVATAAGAGATMGATIVALRIVGDRFACLWAGDSRVYRLRGAALRQITRDHSQVGELVEAGILTPEQAEKHPLANVITRAVGVATDLALDVVEDRVLAGDAFLLCSDGLTRCVADARIAALAAAGTADAACQALLDACLAEGAPDNVSLILVRCEAAE